MYTSYGRQLRRARECEEHTGGEDCNVTNPVTIVVCPARVTVAPDLASLHNVCVDTRFSYEGFGAHCYGRVGS